MTSVQLIHSLPLLPHRADDAHKGTFGRALIIAGSRGMSGAAVLSGTAALRAGAGLVTIASPAGIIPIIASSEPSYMTMSLPEDDRGQLDVLALQRLNERIADQSAIAIGPGLGQSTSLSELVKELYSTLPIPMVVDADALNLLAMVPDEISRTKGAPARILTPHPGEFSRLTGRPIHEIQKDRQRFAIEFAQQHHVVLVLKGHETLITDGSQLAINPTGNSGMATGGSGDVLTGLITGLLAQGMPPIEGAQLATYVHGSAGDLAAENLSKPGLIASDILRFIGPAWCELGF